MKDITFVEDYIWSSNLIGYEQNRVLYLDLQLEQMSESYLIKYLI